LISAYGACVLRHQLIVLRRQRKPDRPAPFCVGSRDVAAHHRGIEHLNQVRRVTHRGQRLEKRLEDARLAQSPEPLPSAVPVAELGGKRPPLRSSAVLIGTSCHRALCSHRAARRIKCRGSNRRWVKTSVAGQGGIHARCNHRRRSGRRDARSSLAQAWPGCDLRLAQSRRSETSRCAGGSSQAGRPGASRLPLKSDGQRGLVREVRI
jgi:hypothetical protein